MKIKKTFLIFAFAIVTIIALLYGVSPQWFARKFLDVTQLEPNIAHIFRAVMGLYLALGVFWLYAAINDRYTNVAVLTTAIFSGGLVLGRILSLFTEGQPAPLLVFYVGAEFILTPIALWVFSLDD